MKVGDIVRLPEVNEALRNKMELLNIGWAKPMNGFSKAFAEIETIDNTRAVVRLLWPWNNNDGGRPWFYLNEDLKLIKEMKDENK